MLSVSDKMKPPTSYLLLPTSYLAPIWYCTTEQIQTRKDPGST